MTTKQAIENPPRCAAIAPPVDIDASHLAGESLPPATTSAVRWFVLHTRPRQEKMLAGLLEQRAGEVFLPLRRSVRYYGHRKRTVCKPLFASYIFLRGSIETTYDALATGRVVNLIHCADQDSLQHEIDQLRSALACGALLEPHNNLERGSHVRVTAGPFAGLEGLVEDRRRPDRLILQVNTLSRAASLEIDADLLEPVD